MFVNELFVAESLTQVYGILHEFLYRQERVTDTLSEFCSLSPRVSLLLQGGMCMTFYHPKGQWSYAYLHVEVVRVWERGNKFFVIVLFIWLLLYLYTIF